MPGSLGYSALSAQDLAAILQEVQNLREIAKEHQWRLDKHSESIQELKSKEEAEPQPLQTDLGEILGALLAANGGKVLAKDVRRKMRMSKQSFTNLLAVLTDIESKPLHTDKRKRVLFLE